MSRRSNKESLKVISGHNVYESVICVHDITLIKDDTHIKYALFTRIIIWTLKSAAAFVFHLVTHEGIISSTCSGEVVMD